MKRIIAFLLLSHKCLSFDLPKEGCRSDLNIKDEHYNVNNTYPVGDVYPTDAHYDAYGNLFYVESGRNDNGFYFNVKIIKSKTTTPQNITGLPEGSSYSIAVNKKDKEVYFGTGQGIFGYNYKTDSAKQISRKDLKLNMIFVDKDGNIFITESSNGIEELYLLDDNNKKIRFHTLEALNELAIDDKNNFYFIKEEKLFVLKSTLTKPVCIGNVSYDGIAQIAIHKENVFIASENLVYYHENESLNLVPNIPGKVTAIAFDHTGDFVLGIPGKLLKYKKNECYLREQKKKDNTTKREVK